MDEEKNLMDEQLEKIRQESLKELENMEKVISENEKIKAGISDKAEQNIKESVEEKKSGHKTSIIIAALAVTVCALSTAGLFVIKPALSYNKAVKQMNEGNYDAAQNIFQSLNYKDSSDMANECVVKKAQDMLSSGNVGSALLQLSRVKEYPEAKKLINENIGYGDEVVAAGAKHTLAVNAVGNVLATGDNTMGQLNVEGWSVKAVAAGNNHSLGLCEDGTVVATGDNSFGQCNVSDWKDIVYIAAGGNVSYGITSEGKVLATGDNSKGMCNTSALENIVGISANNDCAAMLTEDGHVVLCGDKTDYASAEDWYDIKAVSMNNQTMCGLKEYGSVLVCGKNTYELSAIVSQWSNIAYATAGPGYVAAIDKNGEVIFSNGSVIPDFVNLQRIECGTGHIVALTIDGRLTAKGQNEWGECNVAEWGDIMSKQ